MSFFDLAYAKRNEVTFGVFGSGWIIEPIDSGLVLISYVVQLEKQIWMNRDGATKSICTYRRKAVCNLEVFYNKLKKGTLNQILAEEENDDDDE